MEEPSANINPTLRASIQAMAKVIENISDPLHIDNFRNLKFPVSAQTEKNKANKL